jgi:5-methyltetrahydropteroyltriglutamate--homocysteine methyltransferase
MPDVYRVDHVGSLLRPAEVKQAREDLQQGRLDRSEFRAIEDRAILDALERQQAAGLQVFTDGEYRRTGFQNDLVEAVEGFVDTDTPAVVRIWQGPGGEPAEQGTRQVVGGKLRSVRGLTENQLPFLQAHAPGPVKMTVPSPSQFPAISFQPGVTDQVYPTRSELLWEIAGIIKAEVSALVEAGVNYIQVDAPRYSYYVDPKWRQHLRDLGEHPNKMFEEAVTAENFALEGAQGPDVTVAIHICRGNNQSKWYADGGYEPIAEKLFGSLAVDRFLLEYDTERAGTFEPLRFIPPGKMVVLGLISSKEADLEPADFLIERIEEAASYVPLENLALSPQCGFASTAAGNLMTEEQQWRKLELVAEVCRRVWGI